MQPLLYKKNTLAQVFSCEFCEISKNTFLYRTPLVAASVDWQLDLINWMWLFESIACSERSVKYQKLHISFIHQRLQFKFLVINNTKVHLPNNYRPIWFFVFLKKTEAALHRCSYQKMFWKFAANLQENIHTKVRPQ